MENISDGSSMRTVIKACCAADSTDRRIEVEIDGHVITGDMITHHHFPYQVHLEFYKEEDVNWCIGTLISDSWILTAAHCLSGADGGIAHVEEQRIYTSKSHLWTHDNYDPATKENDISLIELPVHIEIHDFIKPTNLPKKSENKHLSYEGKFFWASDWDAESDNVPSNIKGHQFVEVSVIKNSECNRCFDIEITDKMICIEPPNGKWAGRNSGSSLVYKDHDRNILVGVSSFCNKYCERGIPSIYTRVHDYLDWIGKVSGIVNE